MDPAWCAGSFGECIACGGQCGCDATEPRHGIRLGHGKVGSVIAQRTLSLL